MSKGKKNAVRREKNGPAVMSLKHITDMLNAFNVVHGTDLEIMSKKALDDFIEEERTITRTEGMIKGQEDMIIALGRKGWRQKRFEDLSDVLAEVVHEHHERAINDHKDDKLIEYTVAKYDEELKLCLGENYIPWEERYQPNIYTEGIRCVELTRRKKEAKA